MYEQIAQLDLSAVGINASAARLSPASQNSLSDGTWNTIISGDGYVRPYRGFTTQGASTGSRKMMTIGRTWGGIKDNGATQGSGSFFEDIGKSRWGIGAGIPHIEGTNVTGWTLTTNLQLSIASAGVYASPVQAGLAQPSAPELGIISTVGTITNSISAKIERTRPATGARSLASPTSAVIFPQANRARVTFPVAAAGQTHWRVYFTFQGFGGVGIHYLALYNLLSDIPEATVAAGTIGGSASVATGTLTVGTNPSNNETIVINGVTITFKTVAGGPAEVQIGATTTATAFNLATVLNASTNPSLEAATYTSAGAVVTVTFGAPGTAGNAYTLANSSGGNVTRSGATLAGGAAGDFTRSLEFNFQDGDLVPLEASYDDYPPPAATHALRLENVLNLVGCYADSTAGPTSTAPGVAIAVSKQNNYESYVPTHLLYLPEPVVDVLARPIDDYGYIACENSVHAIQYVGDRGDELPPCAITTILPDIGVQYQHNWCHFRGRLLIYTAQGNLILMDESGNFDTEFAGPVTSILKSFTTATTIVGYDPENDSIIVASGYRILTYSLQSGQWRQIWMPDTSVGTQTAFSCVSAKRKLYMSLNNAGAYTAYAYDTGTETVPLSVVSNYVNSPNGNAAVKDIYEMAIAAESAADTFLAVAINSGLKKTVFRRIRVTIGSDEVLDDDSSFYAEMVGKQVLIFLNDIEGFGTTYFRGRVGAFTTASAIDLVDINGDPFSPTGAGVEVLMFVGDYSAAVEFNKEELPNFFPNLVEKRSYQTAIWLKGASDVGNVLTCDLFGTAYASSRAL